MLSRRRLFQELVDRIDEPRSLVGCCGEGAVDLLTGDTGTGRLACTVL